MELYFDGERSKKLKPGGHHWWSGPEETEEYLQMLVDEGSIELWIIGLTERGPIRKRDMKPCEAKVPWLEEGF